MRRGKPPKVDRRSRGRANPQTISRNFYVKFNWDLRLLTIEAVIFSSVDEALTGRMILGFWRKKRLGKSKEIPNAVPASVR